MCEVLDRVERLGIDKGMKEGANEISTLYSFLYDQGRDDDVKKACKDAGYRDILLKEFRENQMQAL